MDILLHHGDHERNAQGFLQRADGARESIQQAMIRLSVPQGSFALDKNLGSRLHTLPNAPKERQEELALEYAQEALLDLPAVRVVSVKRQGGEELELLKRLYLEGMTYEELAAEENLNQNTLAARVRRIKLRFQKIYREIENFSDPPCKKSDTARHKEKRGGSKL